MRVEKILVLSEDDLTEVKAAASTIQHLEHVLYNDDAVAGRSLGRALDLLHEIINGEYVLPDMK
ncbi:MAG: hypothetical protein IKO41_13455 [Lachnospiraceae bacterium]|nr:hypothetical protein [Lachnospiraceae bacterium]